MSPLRRRRKKERDLLNLTDPCNEHDQPWYPYPWLHEPFLCSTTVLAFLKSEIIFIFNNSYNSQLDKFIVSLHIITCEYSSTRSFALYALAHLFTVNESGV